MDKRKEMHDRVLNATNKDELADAYKEWAGRYDHDLLEEMEYVAPENAVRILQEFLNKPDAIILDVGCGTGIVGEILKHEGFHHISGLDYSQHMLDRAGEKGVYGELFQADLLQPLDMDDNCYDAVISVGTFTCGHVGPEALDELVRITRPGGIICFTVREQAWEEDNYKEKMDKMEQAGTWTLQSEQLTEYIKQEGSNCKVCVYKAA